METLAPPQEDLHDETLAAFLGALDDIAASTPDAAELASPDAEIAERVMGLFDTASTFYDADMARNMELVGNLASRLGEMACAGHSHMEGALESVSERFGLKDDGHDAHDHSGHSHNQDRHNHTDGKCTAKCKKKDKKKQDNTVTHWFSVTRKKAPRQQVKKHRGILTFLENI
jgi:hypothetical protein